ncbi:MAG: hypothetical protein ACYC56_09775 [Candidatus Aquicultor sp.]
MQESDNDITVETWTELAEQLYDSEGHTAAIDQVNNQTGTSACVYPPILFLSHSSCALPATCWKHVTLFIPH